MSVFIFQIGELCEALTDGRGEGVVMFENGRQMRVVEWTRDLEKDRLLFLLNDGFELIIARQGGIAQHIQLVNGRWYAQVGIRKVTVRLP